MDNDLACGNGNSMAEALVFWISHGAQDREITHKAENALACVNQAGDDRTTWESIRNVFTHAPYSGLSLLRLVSSGCNPWATDKGRYQEFIQDFLGATKLDLTVHLAGSIRLYVPPDLDEKVLEWAARRACGIATEKKITKLSGLWFC